MGHSLSKRNVIAILGFEALWGFSAPFMLATTILPGYMYALGLSKVIIGMVPAVYSGGIALSQPFSLYLIRSGPGRFRKLLWTYRISGLSVIVMGISALMLPEGAILLRTIAFFACLLGYVLSIGIGDPHYIATVMDSIDPSKRGLFFGLRYLYYGGGGLAAGALAGRVLGVTHPPFSFGLSIVVGGVIIIISTLWLSLLKPLHTSEPESKPSIKECFEGIARMTRRSHRFQAFLASVSLVMLMQGVAAFFVLFIRMRLHAGDSILGWLGSIEMMSGIMCALLLGHVGDRFGYRRAFIIGAILYLGGVAAIWFGAGQWMMFGGYFFTSALVPTMVVAGFHLGFECSGETDVVKVYAGISMVEAPWRIAGPLLAGAVVQNSGFFPIFAGAATIGGVVLVLLAALPKKELVHVHKEQTASCLEN